LLEDIFTAQSALLNNMRMRLIYYFKLFCCGESLIDLGWVSIFKNVTSKLKKTFLIKNGSLKNV
jgi:hypothetical protein